MLKKIEEAADFLKSVFGVKAAIGIVLGTGLGNLAKEIESEKEIPYSEIPNFPISTVEGHSGKLIYGKLNGVQVLAMQGRFHFYEGYDMKTVTFAIRVMHKIGITHLLLSNAAGGMNPAFKIGELMIINDHINLFPEHPLRGKNYEELGPRFPDMSEAYDADLRKLAFDIVAEHQIPHVSEGVYVGTQGPTFETPAEYRFFRVIGGDAVGMSTVPEVIVARHAGMKCFAISIITDLGVEGQVEKVSHEEVQRAAAKSEPMMTLIFKELVKRI